MIQVLDGITRKVNVMRNRLWMLLGLLLTLAITGTSALAQTATPPPPDPNANVSFPPPVYVLNGQAEITGAANLTDQVNYFIEFRPLDDNLQPIGGENAPWFPATLPRNTAVLNGLLGVWDTTTASDGIYALRLTINSSGNPPTFVTVSPIRVDNTRIEAALDPDPAVNAALLSLTATAAAFNLPGGIATATPPAGATLAPTPTDFSGGGPVTAEVIVLSNLRDGDSTLYPVLRGLQTGTILTVLGQSSRGTNWLYVRTPQGVEGWVAPSVVDIGEVSIATLDRITPPPVPFTPTPTPTNTPEVPDLADARITNVTVDRELRVGEAFQIIVTVRNDGTQYYPETALYCNVEPMNAEVAIRAGDLQPGTERQFALPLRIDSGGDQDVNIICRTDMNNEVAEINEDNNTNNAIRRLNN